MFHRLCSTSTVKRKALLQAGLQTVTLNADCSSGVPEQPLGKHEIMRGAYNRMRSVNGFPKWSVESGICLDAKKRPYEVTFVVLATRFGTMTEWTERVEIAHADYKAFTKSYHVTFGKYYASHVDRDVTHDQWYNRTDIISKTVARMWHAMVREAQIYTPMTARMHDFKGVPFMDICDIMDDPKQRAAFNTNMVNMAKSVGYVTHVLAVQSRGFLGAVEVANALPRCSLVLARSEGKMPGPLEATNGYTIEYGTRDPMHIQKGRIKPGDRVIIYDDVLATFGTANALVELVERLGATVARIIAPFAITTPNGDLIGKPKAPVSFVCTQNPNLDKQVMTVPSIRLADTPVLGMGAPRTNAWLRARRMACVPMQVREFTFSKQPWFYGPSGRMSLADRKIYYVIDMFNGGTEEIFTALQFLDILHRHAKEVVVVVPFLEYATQDRVEYRGNMQSLAQCDTLLRLLSPPKSDRQVITFDMHCENSMFSADNLRNVSLMPRLVAKYIREQSGEEVVLIYPDAGAYKRFHETLGEEAQALKYVVMGKKRDPANPDARTVTTLDDDVLASCGRNAVFVIVDDMCRSAGTVGKVTSYILSKIHSARVDMCVTHFPFENTRSLDKVRYIYTTDTVMPARTSDMYNSDRYKVLSWNECFFERV